MIRPDLAAALYRWREALAAGGVAVAGLWLIWLGGLLLVPVGVLVAVLAALWSVQAVRRVRFAQTVEAPGTVEVDEGQVGYLGPTFGGFMALPDLVELRILTVHGKRLWRLKQEDGQALLIPVSAAGAERLFDAFATLPGLETQALVSAVAPGGADRVIWRRGGAVVRPVRSGAG